MVVVIYSRFATHPDWSDPLDLLSQVTAGWRRSNDGENKIIRSTQEETVPFVVQEGGRGEWNVACFTLLVVARVARDWTDVNSHLKFAEEKERERESEDSRILTQQSW